jgi:hypothetical protein
MYIKWEGMSRGNTVSLPLLRIGARFSIKIFYSSFLDLFLTLRILFIMGKILHQKVVMPRLLWLAVFGIAMGLLEAIVVVYLRELYFPGGFRFPLQIIPKRMLGMEVLRETCTFIMLVAAASLCARTFVLRFSLFLFTFGIWDIFYYAFLKVLINWPESLLTWDVLFLIPVTWVGPVLAPLICSLTMIGIGLLGLFLHIRRGFVRFGTIPWLLMGGGAVIIFLTFTWDYASVMIQGGFKGITGPGSSPAYHTVVSSHVPALYPWGFFLFGESLILAEGTIAYRKASSETANDTIPEDKRGNYS